MWVQSKCEIIGRILLPLCVLQTVFDVFLSPKNVVCVSLSVGFSAFWSFARSLVRWLCSFSFLFSRLWLPSCTWRDLCECEWARLQRQTKSKFPYSNSSPVHSRRLTHKYRCTEGASAPLRAHILANRRNMQKLVCSQRKLVSVTHTESVTEPRRSLGFWWMRICVRQIVLQFAGCFLFHLCHSGRDRNVCWSLRKLFTHKRTNDSMRNCC